MKKLMFSTMFSLILMVACNFREVTVTNTVHADGSITREIAVRSDEKDILDLKKLEIPVDSTWSVNITFELDSTKENDTIWRLHASKLFETASAINKDYQHDSSVNQRLIRSAQFTKSFRWFTTKYYYAEKVEKALDIDCPITEFLSEDELRFVRLPAQIQETLKTGADSLQYKTLSDSIENKTEKWFWTCEIRKWMDLFYRDNGTDPRLEISREEMEILEPQLVYAITTNDGEEGDENEVFRKVIGDDFFENFEEEISKSTDMVDDIFVDFWDAKTYDMEMKMPGKIIRTNGYLIHDDSTNLENVLWSVESIHFLTQDYDMWVESRVNNYWIWVVTAVFVSFVTIGIVRFYSRR